MDFEERKKRLREGDQLEISTGGSAFRVWAEPFASPPSVCYEGMRYNWKDLDTVVQKIVEQLKDEDIAAKWVEED